MKNLSNPSYLIYYMEVSEIKDVATFLRALNNIESLAHYISSDTWTEGDLCKRYVCVEVKDYKVRGCNRVNELKATSVTYIPYDPNELDHLLPILELRRLTQT